MAIIRAVAVLKHSSGLARDNCVNTFHFSGDAADDAVLQNIQQAVWNYYYTDAAGSGSTAPVAKYLGTQFTTIDIFQYLVPGTLTPEGRETTSGPPIKTYLGTTTELGSVVKLSTENLPQEVAVCVSFQGTPGPGMVQRRRRGRIYMGPLNGAASSGNAVSPRPSLGIRTTLGESFQALASAMEASAPLVVYSRPFAGRDAIPRTSKPDLPALPARAGTTVNVTQAWVDDEFDTQRRRGLQRTGRTLLTTA